VKFKCLIGVCVVVLMFSLSVSAQTRIPEKLHALIYPGAKVTNVEKRARGGSYAYDVDILIEGTSYKDVVSFYRKKTGKWTTLRDGDVDRGTSFILLRHDGTHRFDISGMSRENRVMVRVSMIKN